MQKGNETATTTIQQMHEFSQVNVNARQDINIQYTYIQAFDRFHWVHPIGHVRAQHASNQQDSTQPNMASNEVFYFLF